MCKKRQPKNRPNWIDPAASSSDRGFSIGSKDYSSKGSSTSQTTKCSIVIVQSLTFSTNWTLIKARDNFYAEYHGSSCPEELESEKDGTESLKFEQFAFTTLHKLLESTAKSETSVQTSPKGLPIAGSSLVEALSDYHIFDKIACH